MICRRDTEINIIIVRIIKLLKPQFSNTVIIHESEFNNIKFHEKYGQLRKSRKIIQLNSLMEMSKNYPI